jgi:hypothetical protein
MVAETIRKEQKEAKTTARFGAHHLPPGWSSFRLAFTGARICHCHSGNECDLLGARGQNKRRVNTGAGTLTRESRRHHRRHENEPCPCRSSVARHAICHLT